MQQNVKYYVKGIEYVQAIVPVKIKDNKEQVYECDINDVEKAIASKILEMHTPLKGAEIKFFRKVLGLSLRNFGDYFDMTDSGVLKWERDPGKPMDKVNEIAVRLFVAEKLNVNLTTNWTKITNHTHVPEAPIVLENFNH